MLTSRLYIAGCTASSALHAPGGAVPWARRWHSGCKGADMTLTPDRSSWLCLPLALLLLAPRVGLAQEAAPPPPDVPAAPAEPPASEPSADAPFQRSPDAPLPGTAQPAPRQLLDKPERPSSGVRIMAEIGASLLTGLGGGVLGLLTGYALGGGDLSRAFIAVPVATFLGVGFGTAAGAYWGGHVTGGQSDFTAALLGMLAGGAVGIATPLLLGGSLLGVLIACPLMMVTGSVIGYEIAETGGKVQPMVGLTPGGASFGLAGTF